MKDKTNILDQLKDKLHDETVILEPQDLFNNAIVGIKHKRIMYDYDKMIAEYMNYYKATYEDAQNCIEFNTCRAVDYMGEYKPIIVYRNDD